MVGWASIGEAEQALYKCLHHSCNCDLYGKPVYAFPHVRRLFTESYLRTVAMKLYALRSADYFRSDSDQDRRYLMYYALMFRSTFVQTPEQITTLSKMVIDPIMDTARYEKIWAEKVLTLSFLSDSGC